MPYRTALAILGCFVVLQLLPQAPGLRKFPTLGRATLDELVDLAPKRPAVVTEEQPGAVPETPRAGQAVFPIEDPGRGLDSFYAALRETELRRPDAVTAILHYGDSPTTADLITADVRDLLQKQFGDAGHGFCLIAKPWGWYQHRGVDISGSGWTIDPATQSSVRDGRFGLGGVSFRGDEGAASRLTLRTGGHTSLEVSYLHQPGGGVIDVLFDGAPAHEIPTGADSPSAGFTRLELPPRARRIELRVRQGPARLFGAYLGKPGAGVVYSSLGLNGAYVSVLARFFQEKHWSEQLRRYRPRLVIVNYGTNESVSQAFVDYVYEKEMKEIVRRLRAALPEASILVMSPMDRGQRGEDGEIRTVAVLPALVGRQRRVAIETGCAFFNTFQAMGGEGTMGRWFQARPRLVGSDYMHPMPGGARRVGSLLYQALLDGYNRYKLRRMQEEISNRGER